MIDTGTEGATNDEQQRTSQGRVVGLKERPVKVKLLLMMPLAPLSSSRNGAYLD